MRRRIAILGFLTVQVVVIGNLIAAPSTDESATHLSPELRAKVGREMAAGEPKLREDSQHHFPGDRWSADDDFHANELISARREASNNRTTTYDVLMAIDADMRAHPHEEGRRVTAAPCRPRPFYD